jgi:hypothetical protein
MALTAARHLDSFPDQQLREFGVAAAAVIHKGALLSLRSSGYVGPLAAGEPLCGLAYESANNASGNNGEKKVRAYVLGDFVFPLSGATVADIGKPVFGVADDALSLTGNGTSYVGTVIGILDTDQAIIRIDPLRRLVKTLSYAAEDLSAGADIAARAIHSFAAQATVVAARIVSQGTAAGIDAANTCVVALAIGGQALASKTYNDATPFPAANASNSLGALTNNFAAAGAILTLAVTQGTNANAPAFVVEVDYI